MNSLRLWSVVLAAAWFLAGFAAGRVVSATDQEKSPLSRYAQRLSEDFDLSGLRRDALILDDGDEARRVAQELVDTGYRGMRMDQLLVGSPDDVAPRIEELHDAGFEEVIVRAMSVPEELALQTIASLGTLMEA